MFYIAYCTNKTCFLVFTGLMLSVGWCLAGGNLLWWFVSLALSSSSKGFLSISMQPASSWRHCLHIHADFSPQTSYILLSSPWEMESPHQKKKNWSEFLQCHLLPSLPPLVPSVWSQDLQVQSNAPPGLVAKCFTTCPWLIGWGSVST